MCSKCDQVFYLTCIRLRPRCAFEQAEVEVKQGNSGKQVGAITRAGKSAVIQTSLQRFNRPKCRHQCRPGSTR